MKTNSEIVLELYTIFDRGDFDLAQELLSENFMGSVSLLRAVQIF